MLGRNSGIFSGLDIVRLRRWLLLFLLAITIPTVMLIYQTYSQLKWEAFHQQRLLAEELSERIEAQFSQLINKEQERPYTDYVFFNLAGNPSANFLQRSPLSEYPVNTAIPGLVGYFQVDTDGGLSTPIVPTELTNLDSYGISPDDLLIRKASQNQLYQILSQNNLLDNVLPGDQKRSLDGKDQGSKGSRLKEEELASSGYLETATSPKRELAPTERRQAETQKLSSSQMAFDQLEKATPQKTGSTSSNLGRIDDLNLTDKYAAEYDADNLNKSKIQAQVKKQDKAADTETKTRKELSTLPVLAEQVAASVTLRANAPAAASMADPVNSPKLSVHTFESEIDPLVFSRLGSGHFVLFRKVWRNGQRTIQGFLIAENAFIESMVNATFQQTNMSLTSNLLLAYRGEVISIYSGHSDEDYLSRTRASSDFNGQLLYQTRLNEPFAELELIFNNNSLPPGPGARILVLLSVIIMLVLLVGFYLMYRLGARQILLARQQQDFVSAVSHELKTPLTSIRMYGEMLQQGWAAADKKPEYYKYIFDESERLSRLINNVLQLARMSRNEQQAGMSLISVGELMSLLESKISTQVESAGFTLNMSNDAEASLSIDVDWFTQIILNLVDNAIKFSASAENKSIDISCQELNDGNIMFSVRDFGPGIEKEQMKSIFKLFYRTENEATRNTIGTGIGLALVHQMTQEMGGSIDVINQQPGAEFRLSFPAANQT